MARLHVVRPHVSIKIVAKGMNVSWNKRTRTLFLNPYKREMERYVTQRKEKGA